MCPCFHLVWYIARHIHVRRIINIIFVGILLIWPVRRSPGHKDGKWIVCSSIQVFFYKLNSQIRFVRWSPASVKIRSLIVFVIGSVEVGAPPSPACQRREIIQPVPIVVAVRPFTQMPCTHVRSAIPMLAQSAWQGRDISSRTVLIINHQILPTIPTG